MSHPPVPQLPPRRTQEGFLNRRPTPREPLLVREAPALVRRETMLTDGQDAFRVIDHHSRHGVDYYRLANVNHPELSERAPRFGWFSAEEIGELAFAKGERREQREGF